MTSPPRLGWSDILTGLHTRQVTTAVIIEDTAVLYPRPDPDQVTAYLYDSVGVPAPLGDLLHQALGSTEATFLFALAGTDTFTTTWTDPRTGHPVTVTGTLSRADGILREWTELRLTTTPA